MRGLGALAMTALLILAMALGPTASAYMSDTTIPQAGGCPAINRWNLSPATPLNRHWSTSLPGGSKTVLTVAADGTVAQLAEIEQAITDSFGVWSGVTGTTFNTAAHPGMVAPLGRVGDANACTNDAESDVDGLNTICFNQASLAFSSGVLAFTRTITANAPGVSVGSSGRPPLPGKFWTRTHFSATTGRRGSPHRGRWQPRRGRARTISSPC